jgi:uncharacterized membrane protein
VSQVGEAGPTDESDWDEDPGYRVPRWWGRTAFVLSVLGLADAVYLTVEHFQGTIPSCPATGVINCAKVTTSPESYVVHIPVALLGLAFFAAMVAANLPPLWRPGHRRLAWLRLGMVTAGLGMVVYLVAAEVFSIKAICLWCTAVHVISVALFVLVVATFPVLAAPVVDTWDGGDGDTAVDPVVDVVEDEGGDVPAGGGPGADS